MFIIIIIIPAIQMTFLKHQILLKNLHIIIILGKSIGNLHNLL